MITYKRADGPCGFLMVVLQRQGSVFYRTLMIAFPCAVISLTVKILSDFGFLGYLDHSKSILLDNAVWSGFTFLVGFLIVFRTSQAYSRFWDGCTSTHMMRAEWFDAVSAIFAFCKYSKAQTETIRAFQNCMVAHAVSLFSMLHALSLAELEDSNSDDLEDIAAFNYDIVNIENIDYQSLQAIKESDCKVELVFQWIQQLLVENIETGVLNIPAPILSRVFQELANGMVQFNEAIKISTIPFPFPYAQTCDALLLMHWLVAPMVISQWVTRPEGAFIFTFMQVFIVWALRCIATEIENPFGLDENDIDAKAMQLELNRNLMMLLEPSSQRTPQPPSPTGMAAKLQRRRSLADVWAGMSCDAMGDVSVVRSMRSVKDPTNGDQPRRCSITSMESCGSRDSGLRNRKSPEGNRFAKFRKNLSRSVSFGGRLNKSASDISGTSLQRDKSMARSGSCESKSVNEHKSILRVSPTPTEPKLDEAAAATPPVVEDIRLDVRGPRDAEAKLADLMRKPPGPPDETRSPRPVEPAPAQAHAACASGGSCGSQAIASLPQAAAAATEEEAFGAFSAPAQHAFESSWRANVREGSGLAPLQLESSSRDGASGREAPPWERGGLRGGVGGAGPTPGVPRRPPTGDSPPNWPCCEVKPTALAARRPERDPHQVYPRAVGVARGCA